MALQLEFDVDLDDDSGSGVYEVSTPSPLAVDSGDSETAQVTAIVFILALLIVTTVAVYRRSALSNPFESVVYYTDEPLLMQMTELGVEADSDFEDDDEIVVGEL